MTPDEMREASREAEIAEWRESNRFCGRCGSEMKPHDDPGESLEDAIRREVREEASIEVNGIRYFGSQTWPFPSNIMIGFWAEYASGELKPDGEVGGNRKDIVEAVNLRRTASMDGPRFLPAYHMNKKTWTTIVLDGMVGAEELQKLLTDSRKLATK